MSLSDDEKINYITSYFHQYFDLVLNTNIETTETINLVVPIDYLSDERIVYDDLRAYSHNKTFPEGYNIEDILLKTVKEDGVEVLGEDGKPIHFYQDVSYTDLVPCICTNVVDGDTIDVIIPEEDEEGNTFAVEETIRLVGVNTPEKEYKQYPAQEGAYVSKEFMEKVCYSKEYLISLKKMEEFSQITEEEIEQMSTIEQEALADEQEYYGNVKNNKKIYLKFDSLKKYASKKKSYDEGKNRRLAVLVVDNKNINEILLKEGLAEIMYIPPSEFNPFEWANPNTSVHVFGFQNSDIQMLSPYFNSDMTNVVFTPKDNPKKIYQYEYYKGVYYIKLQPFSNEIRMHLLPKAYDCSNTVLIFKDDMLKEENVSKTNDYYQFTERDYINSYYLVNQKIRDRTNPDISSVQYNPANWGVNDCFCDFFYDISNLTRNLTKIQICSGYRYNNSAPFYSVHFSGIRDNTNVQIEDRCTLIDANFDKIENISNNITQYHYNQDNQLYIPKSPRDIKTPNGYLEDTDHVTTLDETYRKTLKYINDILYSEESYKKNNEIKRGNTISEWQDLSL